MWDIRRHNEPSPILVWLAILGLSLGAPVTFFAQEQKDTNQGITVAQPKIWRYERIYPLLDGMLRDIENTSLTAMTTLDPNKANLQYLDFLQSMVNLQVDYSQATGFKNQAAVSQANVQMKQLQLDNQYLTNLKEQRNAAISQETTAEQQQSAAQQRVDTAQAKFDSYPDPTSADAKAAKTQLDLRNQELTHAKGEVSALQTQIQNLSDNINKVSTTVSAPAVSDTITNNQPLTSAPTPPKFLDQVPTDLQAKLFSKFGSSDLPASKQLENYLTLLNERLAKELSVITDDATQQGYDLYLMQFDVGLYPPQNTKNHVGRVDISIGETGICKNNQTPSLQVPYAYSLIPGASAYNIQEYIGRHQYFSFLGIFNLLSGLGVSGSYQRQRDQLHDGLVQSIYQSGYMNGLCGFGWYYGPSPFENYVSPGIRSTYALVAVPNGKYQTLTVNVNTGWQDKGGRISHGTNMRTYTVQIPPSDPLYPIDSSSMSQATTATSTASSSSTRQAAKATSTTSNEGTSSLPAPEVRQKALFAKGQKELKGSAAELLQSHFWSTIDRVAYQTLIVPASQTGAPLKLSPQDSNTVLIALRRAADPNLVVTVNGTLLKRARDTRGEAIRTPASTSAAAPPRGIFEAEDFNNIDTWILVDPRTLLLKISRQTAGDDFPTIRLSDPSSRSGDLRYILTYSPGAKVDVNGWTFSATYDKPLPLSAFAPLFAAAPVSIGRYLQATIDDVTWEAQPKTPGADPDLIPSLVRIAFHPSDNDPKLQNRKLNEVAEVVLETIKAKAPGGPWPLNCLANGGDLVCDVPLDLCGSQEERCSSPTQWRLSVFDRLEPVEPANAHTDSDSAPVDVQGFTTLSEFSLLPHFESGYDFVEYDEEHQQWKIFLKGHNVHLFFADPKLEETVIPEIKSCPTPDVKGLNLEQSAIPGDVVLALPTSAYHCLPADIFRPYHVQYTDNIQVEIPNLQWAVRSAAVGNLSIERMEGKTYRLRVGSSLADGMTSITALGAKTHPARQLTKLTSDAAKFEIYDDMVSSDSPYYFAVQIGQAKLDTYSDTSTPVKLCFNFKRNSDCATAAARAQTEPKDTRPSGTLDKKTEVSAVQAKKGSAGAKETQSPATTDKKVDTPGGQTKKGSAGANETQPPATAEKKSDAAADQSREKKPHTRPH